MTRDKAIYLLVQRDLAQLSSDRRMSLLFDWWSIEAGDAGYDRLPDALRDRIAESDQPFDPDDPLYDPLLQIALETAYIGVVNSYLQNQVGIFIPDEVVEGDVEALAVCHCCGYRTLETPRQEYEICQVCFWEDDGTEDPVKFSSPNHMTLKEARLSFKKFGAVSEEAQRYVVPDGTKRYATAE